MNQKDPLKTGGAVVLFENLIDVCIKNNVNFIVVDSNKKNYLNIFIAYISILFQIFFLQKKCDVISLHSSRDYMVLAVFIIIVGKIFRKKTSLRKFGGEASSVFENSKVVQKYILKYIFTNIDILFLEMKYLVKYFSKYNKKTFWFPNVRTRTLEPIMPRKYNKKFVFIGHVRREKGIDEIVEATMLLDKSYTVDIYGPIMDAKYMNEYFDEHNVSYKGTLKADTVFSTLNEYDVILLPSYKEGYPGIIIEAYSLGIPVIATSLQGIKEIVDPYETGILVNPKNVKELIHAIKYFNQENYVNMSESAYKKFDDFESDLITKKFIATLINV